MFAAALRARDCRVQLVTCDGFYQPCAMTRDAQNCTQCQAAMAELIAPLHLPSRALGEMLSQDNVKAADAWVAELTNDELLSARYGSLPIGEWALSTVMTHFRVSMTRQLNDSRITPVHRRFLRDTLLTFWAIDQLLDRESYDVLVVFNARFYPYRAAYEAARRRGLRLLVHERDQISFGFSFWEDETIFGIETAQRLIEGWSEVPLTAGEARKVETYFSEKLIGRSSYWPAFYESVRQADARGILDLPANAKLIAFFSSSPDEVAHLPRFGGTTVQFQLIDTIAQAIAGTDIYLIVRHHPHIVGSSTSPVEVTGFDEAYRQALGRNENVRIIMPSDQLTSYALFPYLTGAIAPFSSIARELIAYGIPTLVTSGSDMGFDARYVFDDWSPPSVATAIDFLTSPEARLQSADLRRFYRKCYNTLYRSSVSFKDVGIRDYFFADYRLSDVEQVAPGQDAALDRVCEHVLVGSRVHQFPSEADRHRSQDEEDFCINEQIDIFRKRRIELGSTPDVDAPPPPSLAIIIDETIEGPMTGAVWQRLANIRKLPVRLYPPKDRFKQALAIVRGDFPRTLKERIKCADTFLRSKDTDADFNVWCLSMLMFVRDMTVDYVLIANPQFQFHDTSLEVISNCVKAAKLEKDATLPLLGWVRDPAEFVPYRFEPIKAERESWQKLRERLGGTLRPQDVLACVIVRRHWLVEHLTEWIESKKTAEEFEEALFEAAYTPETYEAKPPAMQPIFLLQMARAGS